MNMHLRLRTRDLFIRAIDEGTRYGVMRVYKHLDDPLAHEDWNEERISQLVDHIINALDEIVADWGDREVE